MERFELRLSAKQRRGLDALAAETGRSVSDLVRLGLTQLLRKGLCFNGDSNRANWNDLMLWPAEYQRRKSVCRVQPDELRDEVPPRLRPPSCPAPAPALGERRYRSLARRLELWSAALPLERQYLAWIMHYAAVFCTSGERTRADIPSGEIGAGNS